MKDFFVDVFFCCFLNFRMFFFARNFFSRISVVGNRNVGISLRHQVEPPSHQRPWHNSRWDGLEVFSKEVLRL